ncbi:MAG: pilus assembly protein PilB, partial [Acidobacteria bacterium]|nr:pilus assembly protein PilB [Acidobacteriota bacterium]
CSQTGYRGRTAIGELLALSDLMRGLILDKRPSSELRHAARKEGRLTLREAALEKVHLGITTLREINKVTFVE